MKTYVIKYTENTFAFHSRLEDEYRTQWTAKVIASNLVELFTIVNGMLNGEYWKPFYRELVSIEEEA